MDALTLHYEVDGDNFTAAGEASSDVKKVMRSLGISPEDIRRVSICMYEGEINMVIHAYGGGIDVAIDDARVLMVLADRGPGIPDVESAMREGWSTASQSARDLGFGAGMGLPNMKRYCDDMKVETELGVGTTVTMTVNL